MEAEDYVVRLGDQRLVGRENGYLARRFEDEQWHQAFTVFFQKGLVVEFLGEACFVDFGAISEEVLQMVVGCFGGE